MGQFISSFEALPAKIILPSVSRLLAISSKVLHTEQETSVVLAISIHSIAGTICGFKYLTSVELQLVKSSGLRLGFTTAANDGVVNKSSMSLEICDV